MAAGQWNSQIDRGAVWRRRVHRQDSAGSPITVQAPGFMDLRTRPDDDAALIARIDSSGAAEGTMTFPEPGVVQLELLDEVTAEMAPGRYYYDLFVTDSTGEFVRLVGGLITVQQNVSVAP